jgi:DNA-binding transcriptional regulator YhcF (GntR family)
MTVQTAYTALSNAVDTVKQRLARWILMACDRAREDEMPLTHDFIADMLSVRRPSITNALHELEGWRWISSERGFLTVLDRAGLEEFASRTYGQAEAEYKRLLGPMRLADEEVPPASGLI